MVQTKDTERKNDQNTKNSEDVNTNTIQVNNNHKNVSHTLKIIRTSAQAQTSCSSTSTLIKNLYIAQVQTSCLTVRTLLTHKHPTQLPVHLFRGQKTIVRILLCYISILCTNEHLSWENPQIVLFYKRLLTTHTPDSRTG